MIIRQAGRGGAEDGARCDDRGADSLRRRDESPSCEGNRSGRSLSDEEEKQAARERMAARAAWKNAVDNPLIERARNDGFCNDGGERGGRRSCSVSRDRDGGRGRGRCASRGDRQGGGCRSMSRDCWGNRDSYHGRDDRKGPMGGGGYGSSGVGMGGRSDVVCLNFLNGHCRWSGCRFSHEGAGGGCGVSIGGSGGGGGQADMVCLDFLNGRCSRSTGRFSHEDVSGGCGVSSVGGGSGGGSGGVFERGRGPGKEVCRYFMRGRCKFSNCWFSHEGVGGGFSVGSVGGGGGGGGWRGGGGAAVPLPSPLPAAPPPAEDIGYPRRIFSGSGWGGGGGGVGDGDGDGGGGGDSGGCGSGGGNGGGSGGSGGSGDGGGSGGSGDDGSGGGGGIGGGGGGSGGGGSGGGGAAGGARVIHSTAAVLNGLISQEGCPERLLRLVVDRLGTFDHIHVANALSKFGEICGSMSFPRNIAADDGFHGLLVLARDMCADGRLQAGQVSSITHAMAKMSAAGALVTDDILSTLAVLEPRTVLVASDMNPQGAATWIWSYATLGLMPGAEARVALEAAVVRVGPDMDPVHVSTTLWSFATLGWEPGTEARAVLEAAMVRVGPSMDATAVHNTIFAYATLGWV